MRGACVVMGTRITCLNEVDVHPLLSELERVCESCLVPSLLSNTNENSLHSDWDAHPLLSELERVCESCLVPSLASSRNERSLPQWAIQSDSAILSQVCCTATLKRVLHTRDTQRQSLRETKIFILEATLHIRTHTQKHTHTHTHVWVYYEKQSLQVSLSCAFDCSVESGLHDTLCSYRIIRSQSTLSALTAGVLMPGCVTVR
jgi:hypothetical protein